MSISYDICLAHTYLLSVQIYIYVYIYISFYEEIKVLP